MNGKIILVIMVASLTIFSACGTGKKLKASEAANQALQSELSTLKGKISDQQKQLEDYANTRKIALQEFEKYRRDCEESKAKLDVVRVMLAEQYTTLQAMRAKIAEALIDFDDKGVDVFYKDGLVYVSLEDKLLYKPGSSALGADGKKALGSLANALKDYPKLKVIVVGNTDDVPFKKGHIDNLTLSTERANGVVRVLRDEYKIDPTVLTSAGKGKFNPVADNSTAEGRAKNRRTDIILNPDLQRLWESVQK